MKNFILLAFFALILGSCNNPHYEDTVVKNPKTFTTMQMLSNIDTILVSVDTVDANLYQIENGLVTRNWIAPNDPPASIIFIFCIFVLGLILGLSVDKKS